MRSKKLLLIGGLMAVAFAGTAQVQPMAFTDYSYKGAINLNNGGTNVVTHPSLAFQIGGTNKAARPWPILTTTQRDAIASPQLFATIANSTTGTVQVYNGSAWVDIGAPQTLSQTLALGNAAAGQSIAGLSALGLASGGFAGTLTAALITGNRAWQMPDRDGTVALGTDIPAAGYGLTGTTTFKLDSTKVVLNQMDHVQSGKASVDSLRATDVNFTRSISGSNLHTSYIHLPAVSNSKSVNAPIYYRNRPFTDTLYPGNSGSTWDTAQSNSNLHMLALERYLYEKANDTGLYQYGGVFDAVNRMTLDPTSTRWDSGAAAPGGKLWAPNTGGFNMINQLMPGKKTRMRVDPFGRDGTCFNGVIGIGSDSAYNITLQAASPYPMPWSVYKSEFDFDRKILGKQRIIKSGIGTLTGMGTANYLAEWKGWQGGGIAAHGSYIGRHTDYFSHGSIYLQPGGAIPKATMLAESAVDSAVGFYSYPKYNDYNEVMNGWGFVQDGVSDANYFQGLTVFGAPWWPKKATIDSNANTSALFYMPAKYVRNVGSLFDARSFTDKGYVDSVASAVSAGVTAYSAGTGLTLSGSTFKVDTPTIATTWRLVNDSTILRGLINSNTSSIAANTSAIALKKDASDSVALTGYTSRARAQWLIDSLAGTIAGGGGGSGSVTSVSVASANGFTGSVATATSTPAITLGTSVTGILKGNGTAISAATAGTDYATPSDLANYFPIAGGSVTGTAGAGYVGLIPQTSAPSTPASGVRLFASSTGAFSWKGTNGYQRTFSGSGITADRTYTLPDATGTLALTSDLSTYLPTATAATTYQPLFNPLTGTTFFSDFTSTAGEFSFVASGTGTNALSSVNTTANHPGRIRITTGTTSTGRMALQSSTNNSFALGGGATVFETQVYINNLSDGTDRYQLLVGLTSSGTSVNQTDGVFFLYDEGGVTTGSAASANWQEVTASSSTRTFATTSTAVAAAGWTKLRLEINAAGTSVQFYINGVAAGSPITTNIPTAGVVGWGVYAQKSLGTTARNVDADYVLLTQSFTTSR